MLKISILFDFHTIPKTATAKKKLFIVYHLQLKQFNSYIEPMPYLTNANLHLQNITMTRIQLVLQYHGQTYLIITD